MSTPYGISTSIGTLSLNNGFVSAPINGPLNSRQYPLAMPYHSYGTLAGQSPTPPQFYPSQTPINSDMNVNARANYVRAYGYGDLVLANQKMLAKMSRPLTKVIYSSQRQVPVSTHVNYISPIQGSDYVNKIKSISVGKSSYKVGLPLKDPISSKSYDTSIRRHSLQRARSGGCTAPKKKGSIYNYSLTQPGICAWGSLPRQN